MIRSTETRFEELKRYVAFTAHDAAALVSLHPVAAPHFDRIAAAFYDRTRDHEAAHAVFRDEAQVDRLQGSLVRWMGRLCGGTYDEAYYRETLAIGRVHVRIGLPQRYLMAGMSLLRLELGHLAERELPGGGLDVRDALAKILDLELSILSEGYRNAFLAHLHQAGRDENDRLTRDLARTEHRYINAVEKAQALIVGFNAAGVIQLFNLEAERITGCPRTEAVRQTFVDLFVAEEARAAYDDALRGAIDGDLNASFGFSSTLVAPSGKVLDLRWVVSYAPSETEEDDLVLFAIGRDVTEENAMSERSRRHEKLAAVGTLAAGLAHEIRNPLNGAQLHVSFLRRALQKGTVTAEALEAVEIVGDEIRRLATLVTEFLAFARPRPLQRKVVSLREVCERVLPLITPSAQLAGVALVADLPARDAEFSADRGRLEQVLLNLLTNAVEALAPAGRGTVTLRARKQPRHVIFEVIDDGPGLPDDSAPIFDAFFTTKAQGTGLGLSISHRIINDHDGEILVESHPGQTVFRIRLPLGELEGDSRA